MKGISLHVLAIILASQIFFAFYYIQRLQVQNYLLWTTVSIVGVFVSVFALKNFRKIPKNTVILSSIVVFSSLGTLGVLGFQYFISSFMG
jgi:hypothetical protein